MSLSLHWTPGSEPRWSMDTGVGHACLAASADTHRLLGTGSGWAGRQSLRLMVTLLPLSLFSSQPSVSISARSWF